MYDLRGTDATGAVGMQHGDGAGSPAQTLEILKKYQSDRPMNSADISPIFDHVVVGGGQEASQVRAAAGCREIHLLRASCQGMQAHCLDGALTCGAAAAVFRSRRPARGRESSRPISSTRCLRSASAGAGPMANHYCALLTSIPCF